MSIALAIRPDPLFILAPLVPFALVWLSSHLEVGLLAITISALALPLSFATGTETQIPFAVALLGLVFGLWLARGSLKRRLELPDRQILAPALAFVLSALLSFVAGGLPWNFFAQHASLAAQLGGLAVFFASVVILVLAVGVLRDEWWLRRMVVAFLGFGIPHAFLRLVAGLTGVSIWRPLVASADGGVFWIWLLALPAGQALLNESLSRRARLALLICAIFPLAGAVTVFPSWSSGWLPPLVTLLALVAFKSPRLLVVLVAIVVTGLGTVLLGFADSVANTESYSILTRAAAGSVLLEQVFPLSPILGLGPANYYHYTPLYPILGYAVQFNSHNNYIDILLQTGLVGMAAFLWLVVAIGRRGWQIQSTLNHGFRKAYVMASLAALLGMLVSMAFGDWVLPFVYNIGISGLRSSLIGWIFLGGVLAMTPNNSQWAPK